MEEKCIACLQHPLSPPLVQAVLSSSGLLLIVMESAKEHNFYLHQSVNLNTINPGQNTGFCS